MNDFEGLKGLMPDFEINLLSLRQSAIEERFPLSMTWELTPYCNFSCPMCYVHLTPEMARKKGTMLTADQWLELGRQFSEMGLLLVNLTGGEPLTRPDFWEIYEGLCRMGIFVAVFTNGYIVDEKVVERFKEMPPRFVKVSVYGGCNETYEKMCGVKNGFTRVCHALDLLKEAGIPISLTSTIVKENQDDLPLIVQMAKEKDITIQTTDTVMTTARGAASDPANSRLENTRVQKMTLEDLKKYRHEPVASMLEECGSYGRAASITWHGHLQLCNFFEHEYVQVSSPINAEELWKQFFAVTDAIRKPPECADCPDAEFCHVCPGALASASGYADRLSPDVCVDAALAHKRYNELMAAEAAEASDAAGICLE